MVKRARLTTNDSAGRMAPTMKENPEPVFRVSAARVLLYANPAAEKAFGSWGFRPGQEVPARMGEIVSAALAGGTVTLHEIALGPRAYWLTVAPAAARGYVNVYARDITERKQVEEALQESESRLKSIFQAAPVGIGLVSNRVLLDVNDRLCRMTGYRREELVGQSARMLYPTQEDFDRVGREKYRQIRERGTGMVETRWLRKDGGVIDILLSSTPLDPGDLSKGVTFTALDITARKQAEDELRSIFDLSLDMVCIADISAGTFIKVNPAFERTLGYSEQELLSRPFTDFIHPDDADETMALVRGSLNRGEYILSFENRLRCKDGSYRWLSWTARPRTEQGLTYAIARDVTERKQAEEAMRFTQFAIDHTADAAFWMTRDARFCYVNEAACRALGYSQDELQRMTVYDIDPSFTESMWIESWRNLKAKKSIVFETVHRARDGRVYPVEIRANYLEFGGQEFDCAFARDITERKQAEEALRTSEEKFRAMADQAPIMIGVTNEKGEITFLNQAWLDFRGRTLEEEAGWNWTAEVHPQDRDRVVSAMQSAIERGERYSVEYRIRDCRGDYRWVIDTAAPLRGPGGEPRGYIGTALDISKRKQAEESLRESEERFRTAFEGGAVAMALTALDSTLLKVNSSFCRMLGFSESELVGKSYTEITHPDDVAANRAGTRQLASGEISVFRMEKRYIRKDGAVVWADMNTAAVPDAQGRPLYCVTHVQDITERKRAEEALRRSETRLNRSQEIAHLGGWELDLARNELTWSDEVYRIFGLRPQEFDATYEAFLERVHPDDRQAVDDAYRGSVRDGRDMYEIEHRIVRKDTGEVRIVHEKCEHFRDAAGRIVRSVGMVHDITEQKQAEKALRESEARHRRLIENLKGSHFVYVHDTEGVFQYLSESITDVLGYAPDEFMTHYDKYLTDHPANQAVRRGTELSIQGIRQPPYEVNIWHKDGSIRWLEVQEVPVFDADGTVIAVEGVAQDITERKRAEEALRESEQWFRTLTNAMPQLVWTAEPDGRVDYYNERYKEYRGIEPTADGSFQWAPVLHEEDVAPTVEAWERAVRTGQTYQIEHRVQRADGSYHWHLSRGMPIRDDAGRIVKWFGTATDIDDLKQAEEALRDLTATLESKVAQRTAELEYRARQLQKLTLELSQTEDRERRRLADILHDDLQQQLAAVKFHVGLLGNRTRSDVLLQRTVAQLDGMLTDAVETSRSLSHELSPAVLYQGNLNDTFEWLAHQIHTKHGLDVRVHAGGEVHVESDALKAFLYKAAQEMLFNVVKHARVGRADMRIRRTGPYVCLVVSDRGRGFNPQDLKAAAGFGLFSIRERVQLLGGRMKIKSTRGKGSTFFIAVPDERMTEDERQRMEGARDLSTALRPPFSGTVLRVLVVDDHEVVRQGLAALLREEPDMEVVGEAANGREAVDLASRLQPDVIIMDVAMPLMNGDEATRQTKRHLPGIRVIALSMYAEDNMVERMRRAGAECYILKTAPADELLATIRGKKACA